MEKKIASRPQKQDLEDRNILKSGEGSLQSAKEGLKKAQIQDSLKNKLANRPSPSEFEQRIASKKEKTETP